MTSEAPQGTGVAAVYRDDPRLQALIGPEGPFEVQDVVIDGVPVRDFVRAPRSIIDIFDMGAAHVDKVHVVYRDERMTFGELRSRATSLARELQDTFGVRDGDRVAIAMRNLPEYNVAVWGAALAGAIVTPLNSWWLGTELAYALENSEVKVAFLDGDRVERLLDHGRPDGLTIVGVRTDTGDVSFDDLVVGPPIEPDAVVRRGLDDVIAVLYTSGTTDRPKGAAITNRGMTSNLWNMAFSTLREGIISQRPPAPDTQPATLSAGPLFHIGGMTAIFGAPMGGVKMVLMYKWDVEEAVRLAEEEDLTTFGGVPAMARQIIDHPGVEHLGLRFRGFPMGGSAVPPDLPVRAVERFGHGIQLLNGYGLTETTSAVVTNVGEEFFARPDSVGRPNLTADVKIVDPDDRPLPNGEVGEIVLPFPPGGQGLLEQRAGDEERVHRRLVPLRRPRLRRRRRLRLRGRPPEGRRHPRRARTSTAPRSRPCSTSTPASPASPWWASRRSAAASGSAPSWCPARGSRSTWPSCGSSPSPVWPASRPPRRC